MFALLSKSEVTRLEVIHTESQKQSRILAEWYFVPGVNKFLLLLKSIYVEFSVTCNQNLLN